MRRDVDVVTDEWGCALNEHRKIRRIEEALLDLVIGIVDVVRILRNLKSVEHFGPGGWVQDAAEYVQCVANARIGIRDIGREDCRRICNGAARNSHVHGGRLGKIRTGAAPWALQHAFHVVATRVKPGQSNLAVSKI